MEYYWSLGTLCDASRDKQPLLLSLSLSTRFLLGHCSHSTLSVRYVWDRFGDCYTADETDQRTNNNMYGGPQLWAHNAGWDPQMIVLKIMKKIALALLHLAAMVHRLFFIDIWCSFCNTFRLYHHEQRSLMFFVFLDINSEQIALNYTCLMSDLCSQWEGFIALHWPIRGLCHVRPSASKWPVFVSPSFTGCQFSAPHLGLCGTHLIRTFCGCQKLRISH